MGRSIYCSKCKKEKEPGRENESSCKKCKAEARSARTALKRKEKGLPEWGSGRKLTCSLCGAIKEERDRSYCRSCFVKAENRRYQEKHGLTIHCECGNEKESFRKERCDKCQLIIDREKCKADAKKYRASANGYKSLVRSMTFQAIQKGLLIKKSCEVCGTNEKVEAHHDDYTKPLEVRWLCRHHHREHHKNNPNLEDK
jgi:hypothetical protein